MLLGAGESLPKSKYCCLHVTTVRSGTAVTDFLISVRGCIAHTPGLIKVKMGPH